MNNENKYYYINKLPKEYHSVIWEIMIIAKSDKDLYMNLNKQKAKILMRYLYKVTRGNDNWNSLREWLNSDNQVYFCNQTRQNGKAFETGFKFGLAVVLDKMNKLEG